MLEITITSTESLFLDERKTFYLIHAFILSKIISPELHTALGQVADWRITALKALSFVVEYRGNFLLAKDFGEREIGWNPLAFYIPTLRGKKFKQELKVLPRAGCGNGGIKNNNQEVATTSALRAVISMTDICPRRTSVILLMPVISGGSNYKTHTLPV